MKEEWFIHLKEKLKNLPSSPGVYLMKDSLGNIIYVGKSKNLKNRVHSYFQHSRNHSKKVENLINHLMDLEYIQTDTEFEALLLECRLIKDLQPRYNKKMKNPKSYPYIVIETGKEYPTIDITYNAEENDGALYFGPFTNKNTVDQALQGLKEFFKIDCGNLAKRGSPCLNYSIGLCLGMCLGGVKEEYRQIINRIILLLSGCDISVVEEMELKMHQAASQFDFETARKYRDYIRAINILIKKERIIEYANKYLNIAMIEFLNENLFKLFLIKGNQLLLHKKYRLDANNLVDLYEQIKMNILTTFIKQADQELPKISKENIDEAEIIYRYLNSKNLNYITIPDTWLREKNHDRMEEMIKNLLSKGKMDT